eukprot:11332717-Heterocapsa_arctica.AAC.1
MSIGLSTHCRQAVLALHRATIYSHRLSYSSTLPAVHVVLLGQDYVVVREHIERGVRAKASPRYLFQRSDEMHCDLLVARPAHLKVV